MSSTGAGRPGRIVLVAFGTRGDVVPFCVLGRELQRRGHEVRFVTASDYHKDVARFGLSPVQTGEGFEALVRDPEFEPLFRDYFTGGLNRLRLLRAFAKRGERRFTELVAVTCDEVRGGDVVVYNALGYFAGAFAVAIGRPAVRVMFQPLLPSSREPISLSGGRKLGRMGNRLTYEIFRCFSPLVRSALVKVFRQQGVVCRLGRFANPLSANLRDVHHLAAFSSALTSDPGDWPVCVQATGAWFAPPDPDAVLRPDIEAFLGAGSPPIYVGFGSMLWGTNRNTEVVLRALEIWGGRAIVSEGTGGLRLPNWATLPKNLVATTHVNHGLLFPHVAAVVHHGGAGTTAAALRAGKPSVILPILADQIYWGRRVASLGAGEPPVPLKSVTPEDLAGRIARACGDSAMRTAAAKTADAMAVEPGVTAALRCVEALLPSAVADRMPRSSTLN